MIYAQSNLIDRPLMKLIKCLVFVFVGFLLSSCQGTVPELPNRSQNLGDQIALRLQLGMTKAEVDSVIGELKKYVISENTMTIKTEQDIFRSYRKNYFPRNFVNTLEIGTSFQSLMYWINYSGRSVGNLQLYFDADTQRLRGWINTALSHQYHEKFLHERLTSKLSLSLDYRDRLNRKQVIALIGLPTRIIAAPAKETRQLYDDHFWQLDSAMAPILENTPRLEVYEYDLGNGSQRKVFVGYTRAQDTLIFIGYDHAWEEAERYTKETAIKKF
jgi:hypothetical protein